MPDYDLNKLIQEGVNYTEEGFIIVDINLKDHPIVYVNRAFTRLTGYTLDEVAGRNSRFLQGPNTDKKTVQRIRDAISNKKKCTEVLLNYKKNGESFWNKLSLAPLEINNEVKYYVGLQVDITELVKAKDSLEKANKTKNLLFSIISHDLRGPIGALKDFISGISSEEMEIQDNREFFHLASDQLNHTYNMIENLLSWSGRNLEELKLNKEVINLKELVREIKNALEIQARLKKISFELKINNDLNIDTDREIVKMILRNIMSNAVKYTPVNGNIIISATFDDQNYLIEVKDSGNGFSENILESLSKETPLTSSPGTKGEKGFGLGITMARDLLYQLDGNIVFENDSGGKVTISIPRVC